MAPLACMNPGVVGLEDSVSHLTNLSTRRMIAEKYLARHFVSIQQELGEGELENAYWLPGAENPADRLTKVRSDAVPLLRLLASGGYRPGQLRPLKGVSRKE